VPMNLHSRHVRSGSPASPASAHNMQTRSAHGSCTKKADYSSEPRPAHIRPRELVLTTTAASVTAGALYWHATRSLLMSLGVILIVTVTGMAAAWLYAREETRRVQAREQGATERERIRHYAEIQLAEAQKFLIEATTRGPCSTQIEAEAVRLDARKVLELSPPTTVKDAMCITRTPDPSDERHTSLRPHLGPPS
jgi:hypothetical protein